MAAPDGTPQSELIQLSCATASRAHIGLRRAARMHRRLGRRGNRRHWSCPDMTFDEILLLALPGAIVLTLLAAAFLRK